MPPVPRCARRWMRCGFVHVPYLPEQAKDGNAPSMSLALMTKALEIAAEVIVEA